LSRFVIEIISVGRTAAIARDVLAEPGFGPGRASRPSRLASQHQRALTVSRFGPRSQELQHRGGARRDARFTLQACRPAASRISRVISSRWDRRSMACLHFDCLLRVASLGVGPPYTPDRPGISPAPCRDKDLQRSVQSPGAVCDPRHVGLLYKEHRRGRLAPSVTTARAHSERSKVSTASHQYPQTLARCQIDPPTAPVGTGVAFIYS
jgi:hypothetical protein